MIRQKTTYYKMLTPERRAEIQAMMCTAEERRLAEEACPAIELATTEEEAEAKVPEEEPCAEEEKEHRGGVGH